MSKKLPTPAIPWVDDSGHEVDSNQHNYLERMLLKRVVQFRRGEATKGDVVRAAGVLADYLNETLPKFPAASFLGASTCACGTVEDTTEPGCMYIHNPWCWQSCEETRDV